VIYDSEETGKLRKTLLFDEAKGNVTMLKDEDGRRVYEYFGNAYKFFAEVFDRHSLDDHNMSLIGSVHFDNTPNVPGYDNAFFDGDEMAFGNGDGELFGNFTKNLDIVGHELTHGVVQFTANLPYRFQAGALNESMADVFGSMIKQYFGPNGKVLAKDADWLIGEGIFLPAIPNAKALRSMKDPGTAYNNSILGKDPQPADMDSYVVLENTKEEDSGGVHINSGIPNRAFHLAAVGLGGYSWDKAGKIWYAALKDRSLRGVDSEAAFKPFADLTVKYAKSMYDEATARVVREAWTTVKVFRPSRDDL
jgi:Zn-dependent metalloprotease